MTDAAERFAPALRTTFQVVVASTAADAAPILAGATTALVITRLEAEDSAGLSVCAAARQCKPAPTVLVTTAGPAKVPEALMAGCDSVLLEPFAPNLLYARIGRLMRERQAAFKAHLNSDGRHATLPPSPGRGTNRFWPGEACVHCSVKGVTSFEFESRRRAWYACTRCRGVWIGRRLEN